MQKSHKKLNLSDKNSQTSEKCHKNLNLADTMPLPSHKRASWVSTNLLSESEVTALVIYWMAILNDYHIIFLCCYVVLYTVSIL